MSGQPTPGPWRLIADPYPDGSPYFRFSAGDAFSGNPETCGFEFTAIMREADARLIQHSPDVLMALRFIVEQMELPGVAKCTIGDYLHGAGIAMARAAISAATGEEKP